MANTSDVNRPARILVVEDDAHLLAGLRDILEREGYSVITAMNGVEGLQALDEQPDVPDLITSDIIMPEMDGFTFIRELRKKPQYQHIPILTLTARADHESEAKEAGANIFLSKPFDAGKLLLLISDALATK
jgi:CheY-like chemotaxis protein